jgi:hypothetical protein
MLSDEISTLEAIQPRGFYHYLTHKGWKKTDSKFEDVSVFRIENNELVIPNFKFADTYKDLLQEAVKKLAAFERRPLSAIVESLLMPVSDIINFRLRDRSTVGGYLSLSTGPAFFLSCQRVLLATACYLEDPQKHYPKLSRNVAKSFLNECKFNTRSGSFVVNILCPHNAVEEASISESARSAKINLNESFTRTVTRSLMFAMTDIFNCIESGNDSKVLEKSSPVSSNLCKAMLDLCPNGGSAILEVAASDSFGTQIAHPVHFPAAFFKEIGHLASKMSPYTGPSEIFVTGLVSELHGERTADGRPAGDIEVTFQYIDEEIVKARVTLNVEDYAKALNAHGKGHYVSFNGLLSLGVRSNKISEISDFRDLQAAYPVSE